MQAMTTLLLITCLIGFYVDQISALSFLRRPTGFTRLSAHSFNGGKMEHIFTFDDNYCYDTQFSSAEAQQALANGKFYFKVDGQNGMVHVVVDGDSTKLTAYNRYDSRGKAIEGRTVIDIPPGNNPNVFGKHEYFYEEVKADNEVNRAVLDLVDKHRERLVSLGREWVSVEWVGQKFQKTPGVGAGVAMAIHSEQLVVQDLALRLRNYDALRKYLTEECKDSPIEGVVVEHEGTYWKATTGGFFKGDMDSPYELHRANAKAPIYWE